MGGPDATRFGVEARRRVLGASKQPREPNLQSVLSSPACTLSGLLVRFVVDDVPLWPTGDHWRMIRPTIRYDGPPRGDSPLPKRVRDLLALTGGIVSTRELRDLGIDGTALEIMRDYGVLQPVRQGWHCTSDLPALHRLAWRFGGPLACVSALRLHEGRASGLSDREIVIEEPLHIAIPRNAVGAPSPELLARRWGIPVPQPPVLHWGTDDARSGDRRAVSADVAHRQAAICRSIDACDTPVTRVSHDAGSERGGRARLP